MTIQELADTLAITKPRPKPKVYISRVWQNEKGECMALVMPKKDHDFDKVLRLLSENRIFVCIKIGQEHSRRRR
jgi:hypothetical protein